MIPQYTRMAIAAIALLLFTLPSVSFACSMTSNPEVTIALGDPAPHTIDPDEILEGTPSCPGPYDVSVFNADGSMRLNPVVDCDDVGKRLLVKVTASTGNSVWSYVTIEDNLRPVVTAQNVSVTCVEDVEAAGLAAITATDNCTPTADLEFRISSTPSSVGCANGISQTFVRSIFVIDEAGNRSATVPQTITVTRVDIADVEFPSNLSYFTSDTNICPAAFGIPEIQFPTVNGDQIGATCKFLTTVTDEELSSCGASRKILRNFRVLDCCTNEIREGIQFITIVDDQAPLLLTGIGQELPDTINAFNNQGILNCTGTVNYPAITAVDSCASNPLTYKITTPFGQILTNGGPLNINFPLLAGENFNAIYEVADACGNTALDTIVILREDNLPPVAICDEITSVTLNTASTTVPATVFDDGSYDNCGIDSFTVRRMGDIDWGTSVTFTCDDVLDTVIVEFRVTDFDGNANICMVQVIVEDKIPATVNPLPTLTFRCIRNPVDTFFSGVPTVNEVCEGGYQLDTIINDDSMLICRTGLSKRKFIFTNAAGQMIMTTQMINYVDSGMVMIPASLPDTTIDCSIDIDSLFTPQFDTDCETFVAGDMPVVITRSIDCSTTEYDITYTYAPICNNGPNFMVTRNVTQIDDQAPVWDAFPGDLDSTYACELPSSVLAPTASDNCNGAFIDRIDSVVDSSTVDCAYIISTYKYIVRDACGNENPDTITRVIRLRDELAPMFGTIDDFVVDCRAEIRDTLPPFLIVQSGVVDNCPGTINLRISSSVIDTMDACFGSIVRTYIATDACGNASTASQTISYNQTGLSLVLDTLPNLNNLQCYDDVVNFPPPSTQVLGGSACGGTLTITGSNIDPPTGTCPATVIRRFSVEDICGNTGSVSQTFTYNDTTNPVITGVVDLTVSCEAEVPPVSTTLLALTFSDNCELADTTVTDVPAASNTICTGAINRTYTVTDACANSRAVVQVISWDGSGALTLGPLVGNGIVYSCYDSVLAAPTITDASTFGSGICGTTLQIDSVTHTEDPGCFGRVLRGYFVQDDCGNRDSVFQNFTVNDFIAPTISGVDDIMVTCASEIPDSNATKSDLIVTDNCSGRAVTLQVLSEVVISMETCTGSIVRTYIATDACDNTTTAEQIISYDQTTTPLVLNALDPVSNIQCYDDVSSLPVPTITAANGSGCMGTLTLLSTDIESDPDTCRATVLRTFTVSDECGRVASVTQAVVFEDTIEPIIDGPAVISVTCVSDVPTESASLATLTVTDNCGLDTVVVTNAPNPANNLCFGNIVRTYVATDNCGNTASITQEISWDQFGMLTLIPAPVDDSTYQCYQEILSLDTLEASYFGMGICGTELMITNVTHSTDPGCGAQSVTRIYAIEDECQNSGTVEQTFMINDTTPSTFAGVLDTIITCRGDLPSEQTTSWNISVTDNCVGRSASFEVTSTIADQDNDACSGFWIRTYTATDECNNTSIASQRISYGGGTLILNDLPEWPDTFLCYQDVLDFDPGYTPSQFGEGACGTTLSFVGTPTNSADPGCVGEVLRTFNLMDECGNTGTATQTLVVKDTVGPELMAPFDRTERFVCEFNFENLVAQVNNGVVNGCNNDPSSYTFTNNSSFLSGTGNANSLDASGVYPVGTTEVTYTATDICGNSDSVTTILKVDDGIQPTVFCSNIFIELDENAMVTLDQATIRSNVVAVDNCDAAFDMTYELIDSMSVARQYTCGDNPPMTFPYTYRVTDRSGNSQVATCQIILTDKPQIDCDAELQYTIGDSGSLTLTQAEIATALNITDNCSPDNQLVISSPFLNSITYDCTNLGTGPSTRFQYSISVKDTDDEVTTCNFFVTINHSCLTPPEDPFTLTGRVDAPLYGGVMDATEVEVTYSGGSIVTASDEEGYFSFSQVPSGAISLSAKLPMPVDERVTTYDMLRIGQHLLGIQVLEDPLLLLAADVNKSGNISAFDVTAIRRVILGHDQAFNSVHESTTVGANHPFSNETAPWTDSANWGTNFPYVSTDLNHDISVVKLGDINPTDFLRPRSASELVLEDKYVEKGERVEILVRNDYQIPVAGLQLALHANGLLEIGTADDNIEVYSNEIHGATRIVILQELLPGEPVMTWTFTALNAGMLSELIQISDDIPNESYVVDNFQPTQLALQWNSTNASGSLSEINAFPNPFDNHLNISAHLTNEGKHMLKVTDMAGRSFAERRIDVEQDSWHNLRLDTDKWSSGVYILTLEGPSGRLTQRVVLQH